MEKGKERFKYIITVVLLLIVQFLLQDLMEPRKELKE